MLIERDDVRLGNIDAHTTQVAEFSKANVASMAKMMFENLHQITEATGNVLDAKGERLSIDMLIDLIEKTEWRFDDDGNVVRDGQAFVVHPDLAPRLRELEETQEHRDRMEELRTTKLAEWNASRRCRRIGKESK
ncbi:MAG: hypothetical protein GC165_20385 [Armatimonadetes bacterium]|nr:hypothetical protein [Armatimonadota bacterium]